MAVQPDTLGLYPQCAPDGTPIPFDIVRVDGLIIKSFGAAAVNNIPIPASAELLVIQSTQDCIVSLDADIVVAADGVWAAKQFFCTAHVVWILDLNGAAKFGVIRAGTTDGTLYVQTIRKWKDLRKSAQFNRM